MIKLNQLVPSDFCIACLGCCRFAKKNSVWQPYRISPIPYKDYFICPHLEVTDNKCEIYAYRPLDCQLYPFVLNRHKKGVYLAMDLNCAYIKHRPKDKQFQQYLKYLLKFLKYPAVKKFLKDSPGFICEYKAKDVENLAVLDL